MNKLKTKIINENELCDIYSSNIDISNTEIAILLEILQNYNYEINSVFATNDEEFEEHVMGKFDLETFREILKKYYIDHVTVDFNYLNENHKISTVSNMDTSVYYYYPKDSKFNHDQLIMYFDQQLKKNSINKSM